MTPWVNQKDPPKRCFALFVFDRQEQLDSDPFDLADLSVVNTVMLTNALLTDQATQLSSCSHLLQELEEQVSV
jgi:hypothetical protein